MFQKFLKLINFNMQRQEVRKYFGYEKNPAKLGVSHELRARLAGGSIGSQKPPGSPGLPRPKVRCGRPARDLG